MANRLFCHPRPAMEEARKNYPIIRCDRSAKFKLPFFVLSTEVFGLNIHFAGKSVPCVVESGYCAHCADGKSTRWVGYVAACDHLRQKLFIAELTPGVMPTVDAAITQFGNFRGCHCTLSRPSMKDNGRLDLVILPPHVSLTPADLPPSFDIEQVLMKIYGITPEKEIIVPAVVEAHEVGETAESAPKMKPLICERQHLNDGRDVSARLDAGAAGGNGSASH